MAGRIPEGYSKVVSVQDPTVLDTKGNSTVVDIGDSINGAAKVNVVTALNAVSTTIPAGIYPTASPVPVDAAVFTDPLPGDLREGLSVYDRQQRTQAEISNDWLRKIFMMLAYIASGGLGTGQTVVEYFSSMGMELNPLDLGQPEGQAFTINSVP